MASAGEHIDNTARPDLSARVRPAWMLPWYWQTVAWAGIFVVLTLLVHTRALAGFDRVALQAVASTRPDWANGIMNWIFRLGFVQVDSALAVIWSGYLAWRWIRSTGERPALTPRVFLRALLASFALAPMLLFAVIGAQAGLRLLIEQPAPGPGFAIHRPFAAQPVADVLDRTDAAVRQEFLRASTPPGEKPAERGSYPSGHSSRMLFLGMLAVSFQLSAVRRRRGAGARTRGNGASLVVVASVSVAAMVLVSYSAMYFGYHWPTDIVGGLLLGLAVLPVARRMDGHSTS